MTDIEFRLAADRLFEPQDRLVRARLKQMYEPNSGVLKPDVGIAGAEPGLRPKLPQGEPVRPSPRVIRLSIGNARLKILPLQTKRNPSGMALRGGFERRHRQLRP